MDIQTHWDVANSRGDWQLTPTGQLSSDADLKTAVLMALFTWARALSDDVLPEEGMTRKGWWGDALNRRHIGSRLWLLQREKQTRTVVLRAQTYAEEALQWLVDDGVCRSVTVIADIAGPGVLGLRCTFLRDHSPDVVFQFDFAWSTLSLVKS